MKPPEMVVACVTVLVVFAIGVGVNLPRANAGTWTVGGDFIEFYTAGRILNDHHDDRLYDLDLQLQVNREVVPGTTSLKLPFLYAPFVAGLFRPLAHLPFSRALVVFLVITPLLFLGALALLNDRFGSSAPDERALVLLAGLSFFPFLGYNWLGAQISVIGFGAVALALCEEDRGRPFRSGLALSLCLYKPSLLVLILPMLIVSARFRQFAGFLVGAGVLTIVCVMVAGSHSTLAFIERLGGVITQSTTSAGQYNLYRYVDLNAFFRLLPYGRSIGGYVLLAVLASAAAIALVRMWVHGRTADRPERLLVWAATLTWTLVLNIYTPFYDSILVVAAAILAVAAVRARGWVGWNRLAPALLCVYLAPWVAEISARALSVQLDTLVLGGFGTLLLLEAPVNLSQRGT
jgi:Glycosyltransferase family 87